MRKIIFLWLFILCGMAVKSQIYNPVTPTVYGRNENRERVLFALGIPEKSELLTLTNDTSAQIFYNKLDSSLWGWSNARGFWKIGFGPGNSSGIDSMKRFGTNICYYKEGIERCFDMGAYYVHSGSNFDGTRTLYYNIDFVLVDSSENVFTDLWVSNDFKLTDTLSGIHHPKLLSLNGTLGGTQDLQSVTDIGSSTTHQIVSDLGFSVESNGGQAFIGIVDTSAGLNQGSVNIGKHSLPGFDDRGALEFVDYGARYVFITVDSISGAGAGQSKILLPVGDGRIVTRVNGLDPDINGDVTVSIPSAPPTPSFQDVLNVETGNATLNIEDTLSIGNNKFNINGTIGRLFNVDGSTGDVSAPQYGTGSYLWEDETFLLGVNGAGTFREVSIPAAYSILAHQVKNERFTGSTSTTITTAHNYSTLTIEVWKNGAKLDPTVDWSEATANTFTLSNPRLSGDIYLINYNY